MRNAQRRGTQPRAGRQPGRGEACAAGPGRPALLGQSGRPFPLPGSLPSTARGPRAHSPEIVLLILTKIFSKSAKSLQDDWNMCMKRLMKRFSILHARHSITVRAAASRTPSHPGYGASRPQLRPGQLLRRAPCRSRTHTGTHADALPPAPPRRELGCLPWRTVCGASNPGRARLCPRMHASVCTHAFIHSQCKLPGTEGKLPMQLLYRVSWIWGD